MSRGHLAVHLPVISSSAHQAVLQNHEYVFSAPVAVLQLDEGCARSAIPMEMIVWHWRPSLELHGVETCCPVKHTSWLVHLRAVHASSRYHLCLSVCVCLSVCPAGRPSLLASLTLLYAEPIRLDHRDHVVPSRRWSDPVFSKCIDRTLLPAHCRSGRVGLASLRTYQLWRLADRSNTCNSRCTSRCVQVIWNRHLFTHSARNLRLIFDENLTFSDQISSLSNPCYSHIRDLRCIRPHLGSKTASSIAASPNLTTVTLYYHIW